MSEEQEEPQNALVLSQSGDLIGRSSRLIQRGLKTLEQPTVTIEQIHTARNTTREFRGLSDEAIRITLERPVAWQLKFVAQLFTDEVAGYASLRSAIELGIVVGTIETIEFEKTRDWITIQLDEIVHIVNCIDKLIDNEFNKSIENLMKFGNTGEIIVFARKLGLLYKQILDFQLKFFRFRCDKLFEKMLNLLPDCTNTLAHLIQEFGPSLNVKIDDAISMSQMTGKIYVNLSINLDIAALSVLQAEIKNIAEQYPQRLSSRRSS